MVKKVFLLDGAVTISDLDVPRKDVADFLRSVEEPQVEATLIQAIEVGVFCLERARMSQDVEFVRRQLDSLLNRVEFTFQRIPGETQKALVDKIGTNNGQVLAPIKEMIDSASRLTAERLKEVRTLLTQEIDPDKETSTLGKALKTLRNLLDPRRSDSVQSALERAVNTVTGKEGTLADAVRQVVSEAVKPLADEVDKLAKEIRGQEAAAEALDQTTGKGQTYEEEVLQYLQQWTTFAGASLDYVGSDNKPGDIVISMPPDGLLGTPLVIVIETRDRQSPAGRKVITDTLSKAMLERKATAAVYLSKTRGGLGVEIGEWADGMSESGPFVSCTHENIHIALRWLVIQTRIARTQEQTVEVDAARIARQMQRIRTALDRVKTINRRVTDIRTSATDIQTEAEALREDIKSSLNTIDDAFRTVVPAGPEKTVISASPSTRFGQESYSDAVRDGR